jgi:hypothetical protein
MVRANACAKQQQFGGGEFTAADAEFLDDDEDRDGADESECYCRIGNKRYLLAPSVGATLGRISHITNRAQARPACGIIRVSKIAWSRMKSLQNHHC